MSVRKFEFPTKIEKLRKKLNFAAQEEDIAEVDLFLTKT